MRSVSASESTVSISLRDDNESLARPFTSDGVASVEESVIDICGTEGVSSVELLDATEDALVARGRCPFDMATTTASSSSSASGGDCGRTDILSDEGDATSGGWISMSVMVG